MDLELKNIPEGNPMLKCICGYMAHANDLHGEIVDLGDMRGLDAEPELVKIYTCPRCGGSNFTPTSIPHP